MNPTPLGFSQSSEGITRVFTHQPLDGAITAREWFDYAAARVPQMQTEVSTKPAQPPSSPQQVKKESTPVLRPQQTQSGGRKAQAQQAQRTQPGQNKMQKPNQSVKPDRDLTKDDVEVKEETVRSNTGVQQPRVFYRREEENKPLIVAKP